MPAHLKAMLSVLVGIVALVAFWLEGQSPEGPAAWIILALGAFMIVAMWVFPEAGKDKVKKQ